MTSEYRLRHAEPNDLATLIAIDDEASVLYTQAGLKLELAHNHPFVLAEAERWAKAITNDWVTLAVDQNDAPVGFSVCGLVDNQPYLDQLSVAPKHMRQGIGTTLLMKAIEWSASDPLWLTTYASIDWNQPFYERYGFVAVPEPLCGPQLRNILHQQRSALPAPEDRVAMVRYGG
ncbi:hypothetical protein BGP77_06660 [Saccharospirillum sp. MSK14-1]|uniref:GNAT family N-acetyltransferase n=1 Tax=Saccharospirillum sp. MSK14-1 TaxID=1897632 RepID=UPI000D3D0AA8|nr:GNAT family N-acetyltransferase [Saccharospirillum sp. MSK14-1]PTY36961.1 hypothetical protein BGP77_06660 [Saccharospirillum sp. MSK14-1]